MVADARRIIDAAREQGLVLRLIGGLAVRFHCETLDFCERDHGDIDLVGHRRDATRIATLFATLGLEENVHVRLATGGRQLQFAREGRHKQEWAPYGQHNDDHVDVFLDTFKMDHTIDLTDRLDPEGYTITVSDVLLTKLQMARLNEKDERDIFYSSPGSGTRHRRRPGRSTCPMSPGFARAIGVSSTMSSPTSPCYARGSRRTTWGPASATGCERSSAGSRRRSRQSQNRLPGA